MVASTAAPSGTDPEVRREIIGSVRRFVEREVAPVASDLEHADAFPAEIVEQMRELGLFGVTIPESYGGLGLDLQTYIGVIEELAYGWMSLTGIVNTHTMAATLIMAHGTDEQKQRWLPTMATGERRGALSLSEPDAGSDTRNISCKAELDGEEYVVNGTKAWVTNGERAAIVALAARTAEGISAFVVEKEPGPAFEGISVSRQVGKLGYKGVETVEMVYADHRIPAANLVGEPGRGLAQILGVLEVGRINIAARATGVARAALDAALGYATPTYKATYTGLLKLFLDQFGAGELHGTTAVALMLGASPHHALAGELTLKPVLSEIGCSCPTPALFLLDSAWDAGPELDTWIERARDVLGH